MWKGVDLTAGVSDARKRKDSPASVHSDSEEDAASASFDLPTPAPRKAPSALKGRAAAGPLASRRAENDASPIVIDCDGTSSLDMPDRAGRRGAA